MESKEIHLVQLEWQPVLFADSVRRADLMNLSPLGTESKLIGQVWRNWPVEMVAQLAVPFLSFSELAVDWSMSDYDESLAFADVRADSDFDLIALDVDRYEDQFVASLSAQWFESRVLELRDAVDGPIFIMLWTLLGRNDLVNEWQAAVENIPGVYFCDSQGVIEELGDNARDARGAVIRATELSDAACVEIARQLGLRWIPSLFSTPVKAIAVDLDNTLYTGILGEDGVENLRIDAWQSQLNTDLKAMADAGVLIALVSKNVPEDVDELFSKGVVGLTDRSIFSKEYASWNPKEQSLKQIAIDFNIGTDSVLFVDDNIGELLAAKTAIPETRLMLASQATGRGLRFFPGLFRNRVSKADELRAADIAARIQRERTPTAVKTIDYLESLDIGLRYDVNDRADLARASQLAQKTNQFNLSLRRTSEKEVSNYLAGDDRFLVTVSLRDRLSDSGNIGVVMGTVANSLVVDELCISCRALGRGIDNLMVLGAIKSAIGEREVSEVFFKWSRGPRNMPALDWLANYSGSQLEGERGEVRTRWNSREVADLLACSPIKIETHYVGNG